LRSASIATTGRTAQAAPPLTGLVANILNVRNGSLAAIRGGEGLNGSYGWKAAVHLSSI
jgi:hypothetical protein